MTFRPVVLSAFSAGYGAVREILRQPGNWGRIHGVVLADGLHAGYEAGDKPGPVAGADLEPFAAYARHAAAGHGRFLITHSEIFPGTFASTTECTDYLLSELGRKRRPVLHWGPLGMQQLSDTRARGFRVLGFAGNSAPDHVDHFHALAEWLRLLR